MVVDSRYHRCDIRSEMHRPSAVRGRICKTGVEKVCAERRCNLWFNAIECDSGAPHMAGRSAVSQSLGFGARAARSASLAAMPSRVGRSAWFKIASL
jgi:hypothetical protein